MALYPWHPARLLDTGDKTFHILQLAATGRRKGGKGQTASQKMGSLVTRKKAARAKLKGMTKEARRRFKDGKRNKDSDSEYSYKSDVSAGGTRHVNRRRKRKDGTYSDAESYHSGQDEGGAARRRQRRRDREHGTDSDHSYYSVVSEGGTRHVRRRRRNDDGTYSRSESYRSSAASSDGDGHGKSRRRSDTSSSGVSSSSDDYEEESDASVFSDVSDGGTRRMMQKKRIRDADGNVVGYGDSKPIKERRKGAGSESTNMASLQSQRNGELLREMTTDSLSQLREDGESILGQAAWPGQPAEEFEQMILAEDAKAPSDFSDSSTEDDIDLSKLNPAQRRQYLAQREKRKKEREKRRREKYGDKYDEILKNKKEKEAAALEAELETAEKERQRQEERWFSSRRRTSTTSSLGMHKQGRPRSMVTYDKGTPRAIGYDSKVDNREAGLAHTDWVPKKETDAAAVKRRRKSIDQGGDNNSESLPKLLREKTMINKLPSIPQGRMYVDRDDGNCSDDGKSIKIEHSDGSDNEEKNAVEDKKQDENEKKAENEDYFEVGKDGKVLLTKKKIDLNKISADQLRSLGIDPNMSAKAIAKRLKQMFGKDVIITDGDKVIGTKGIDEYGRLVDDETLANDPDLDVDTLSGLKRVNIMMRRGGSALRRHLEKVLGLSKIIDRYAKDLDERDADIDFLSHYRLVDPGQLDAYARAFVVEDSDLDTVINSHEVRVALDGVPSIQNMTDKQISYVLKVLHIDEASLITFKMFAVVTALCERVTHMDSLSQRLLEICNLADIERKLDLYNSMFYHNTRSDRSANFVTSESLKIELIAGGLNWKQQQYIMEKMEPNDWGEVSFLDFMCYIPLFLSMHDNICDNPFDMSNEKYQAPPRRRRPSVQRDMNPLGCNLRKTSAYWIRKHAMEMIEESRSNATQVSRRYMDIFSKYTSERYMRLKKIEDCRQTNMMSREQTSSSFSEGYEEMIY